MAQQAQDTTEAGMRDIDDLVSTGLVGCQEA
jgi:hypothetical protein